MFSLNVYSACLAAICTHSFYTGVRLALAVLAQPMTQSLLHQSVPEQRVREALGARLAMIGGAQAASPLVFGFMAQSLGIEATLWAASVLLVGGGVYAVRAGKGARRVNSTVSG